MPLPPPTTPVASGTPSLPDLAYDYLRSAILSGQLAADEPLRQEEIGARLGISRLPVREALRRLDVEGLVVLRPRRGYAVAPLSRDEIDDVFEVQGILEAHVGALAAKNRSDDDIAEMERHLARLDQIIADDPFDLDAFISENEQFHNTLFASAGRPYLYRILGILQVNIERYSRIGATLTTEFQSAQTEHHAIVDAFRDGDTFRLARLCQEHRENTRNRMLKYLDLAKSLD